MRRQGLFAALALAALLSCSSSDGLPRPGGQLPPPGGGSCVTGAYETQACGSCGWQDRYCSSGSWTPWSSCWSSSGACAAGAVETAACGTDEGACTAGTATRTCSSTCAWGEWSACGGAYVGPADEVCANGVDEDCDGTPDDLCEAFAVTGQLAKLVASPDGATVFALDVDATPAVVVLDAASRAEVARIALPQAADDMDLSPSGQHLVVAHDLVHQISKIDPAARTLSMTKPVASDPYRIEVSDAGVVYYAELDQWCDIRRVAASLDFATDTLLRSWGAYAPDLELSADGAFLYTGESGTSGGALVKWDVSAGGMTLADESTWDDGYGFWSPSRHLLVSADGRRAYYAGYQLDAGDLALVVGQVGRTLAEDPAGQIAVGELRAFDARTLADLGALPVQAAAAAFVKGGDELWLLDAASGRIVPVSRASLVGDATLGSRSYPAEPLGSYAFTRLVRDPSRNRLYGLDTARDLVVAIDATTLAPLGAVLVGSTPTDLALSLAGDALWVGHLHTLALARIDLATFAFDRFVAVPREPYEVEALSGGRLAIIDEDQWTTPTLVDASGAVLASASWGAYEGALAATADGNALFVAESSLSGSEMIRYDVSAGALTQVTRTTYDGGYGFPYPPRGVVPLADGSAVYYAGFLLDGTNLAIILDVQADRIRTVTPDGRLAVSATRVYAVADGAELGTLPSGGSVQALSPDGATLYVSTPGALATVDLSGY